MLKVKCQRLNVNKGFSLMEIIVGVSVFAILSFTIYQGYNKVLEVAEASRYKTTAAAIANEQFEVIRNLPYSSVGIQGGLPVGTILRTQNVTRDNVLYTVTTTIRNIDDPFDGTIGGTPNDTSPADYKLVELGVSCSSCKNFDSLKFNTQVAPRALETATQNGGALFIRVFDANGQSISGANVHVENQTLTPSLAIDDTTNNQGVLQLVDIPEGEEAYAITVSKTGYSQDRTYSPNDPQNPNPIKPHATVKEGEITQISFAIDKVSAINVQSRRTNCNQAPSIDFLLQGAKLIGQDPNVLKYNQTHVTDGTGRKSVTNLEWDNYNVIVTDNAFDLNGTIPLLPVNLVPNSAQDLELIVAPKNPKSLVVTVKDAATALSITGASVTLQRSGFTSTLVTGRGFLGQTDWSGGGGQVNFINETRYFNSDGNIETGSSGQGGGGELKLKKIGGDFQSSGWLESSTFDTGASNDFQSIIWQPQDQQPETGADSVKFQIASSNNQNGPWNFQGPGGANSYYTLSNTNLDGHKNKRYFRYKVFLSTQSQDKTPNVSDIAVTFTSACVPPGQVLFSGLSSGSYTLTVSKTGYQTFTDNVDITLDWQQREVILIPQ